MIFHNFYLFLDFTKLIKRIVKIPSLRENAVAALNLILQPEIPVFDFISEEGPPHEKIFTTELNFLDHNKVHQTFVAKGAFSAHYIILMTNNYKNYKSFILFFYILIIIYRR